MTKSIRTNLAYLRTVRGKISQKAISDATGIGQKTISALETGTSQGIEFSTLLRLCAFFKCTPNDLLIIEEIPDEEPPSAAALKKADELIARGLKAATAAPAQTAAEVWAEFDQVRAHLQAAADRAATPDRRRA